MNALAALVCLLLGMALVTGALTTLAEVRYRRLERDAAQALRLRRAVDQAARPRRACQRNSSR